jgi:RNA polymerase sigma factor (sigma-70 family)
MATRTSTVPARAILAAVGATSVSDRELLRRFADGDQAAFAALFRRHGGMVLGVCRRALSGEQDAEDACQATFLILSRKAATGRWQPSLANWLYLTARRVARNARLAAARRTRHEHQAAKPAAVQPLDRMTGRELLEALDAELDRLPPIYREPLVLCYLEGLAREEAAGRLGVPLATLKSRLERGRKQLGDALTRKGCMLGAGLLALASASVAEASPPGLLRGVVAIATGTTPETIARLAGGIATSGFANRSLAAVLLLVGSAALGLGLFSAGRLGGPMPIKAPPMPSVEAEPPVESRTADNRPASRAKTEGDLTFAANRPGSLTIAGHVLGPDGKPVAGARLLGPANKPNDLWSEGELYSREVAASDQNGHFTITIGPAYKDFPQTWLVAFAPGYGIDWVRFGNPGDPNPAGEHTLQLSNDVPITGRIVSTEGRPLAGVTVSPAGIYVPDDGNLDACLARWKEDLSIWPSNTKKSFYGAQGRIVSPAVTDRDGRFSLPGAGADRIVLLLVEGGGVARSLLRVVTRAGFDPKSFNDGLRNQYRYVLRGLNGYLELRALDFTYVAEPGQEVFGVVTDSATGQPVADCAVLARCGLGADVVARTDPKGNYRLTGLPGIAKESPFTVRPPEESAYLPRTAAVTDKGFAPANLDIGLAKGAVVTGRVVDKQTGKGLRAILHFAALANNTLFGSKPEYSFAATDQSTDANGQFQALALPGPCVVLVQVRDGESYNGQRVSPYRSAVPDPDHKNLFRTQESSWIVATTGGPEHLINRNIAKVVDVNATGKANLELLADRGTTGKITVQDAEGRPLAGAWVSGLADYGAITFRMTDPTATVYALDVERPRTLAFYHPEKRLGGTATVRGDEKEPVVAKIEPLGRVTGRLLDIDRQPLAGLSVVLDLRREIDTALYRTAGSAGVVAVTDKDGRFTLDAVVPGMRFGLQVRRGRDFYSIIPIVGQRQLKAGETFDCGERIAATAR